MSKQPTEAAEQKQHVSEHRLGFWQQRWVQDGLPLGTSMAVHVGLLILGLVALHAVMREPMKRHSEELFIPTMVVGEKSQGADPLVDRLPMSSRVTQSVDQANASDGKSAFKSSADKMGLKAERSALGDSVNIALGDPMNAGTKGGGLGESFVDQGGKLAPFGIGTSGHGGDGGMFTGGQTANPNAKSAVYICDGSGSMVGGKDEALRVELKKAVGRLSPIQSFNVLFFQQSEGKKFASLAGQLQMGSSINKARLNDFVDNKMTFHGVTNPIPAIEEAFREKPQMIYLLTDGAFEDNDTTQKADSAAVMARIGELNKDKLVHVNTILLMGSKKEVDELKAFEDVMKQLAKDNGGVYVRAVADEL